MHLINWSPVNAEVLAVWIQQHSGVSQEWMSQQIHPEVRLYNARKIVKNKQTKKQKTLKSYMSD